MEQNELIEKEYEVYILTGDDNKVGTIGQNEKHFVLPIVAYVIKNTGELVKNTGKSLRDKIKVYWDEEQNIEFEKQKIYLLKCKAKVLAENEANAKPKRLIVEDVLENGAENEQLKVALEEYNMPIIKKDEQLGEFILDKRFNCFRGKLNLLEKDCKISLAVNDINDCDVCIEFLKQICDNIKEFDTRVKDFIAEKLLNTAIEWNDDRIMNKEEFISNLSLYDLSIDKSGSIVMYYYCENVFLGHNICVRGNADGELKKATIEG